MKLLTVVVLLASPFLLKGEQIEAFGLRWTVPFASDWKVEQQGSTPVLRMLVERPQTHPRRPIQFALAETPAWSRVRVEAEVKRIATSLIVVYAWRDEAHFNYAHLSVDTAAKQPVHNGVFHVYGGERVRISPTAGPGALPRQDEWYRVRLDYDAGTGEVTVWVNGERNPSLHAVDLSLGPGKVGLGSFFETAMFRNVRITGTPAP